MTFYRIDSQHDIDVIISSEYQNDSGTMSIRGELPYISLQCFPTYVALQTTKQVCADNTDNAQTETFCDTFLLINVVKSYQDLGLLVYNSYLIYNTNLKWS